VPKQGPNIDPKTSWLENFVDAGQVLANIVSSVDKEASDNTVPCAYRLELKQCRLTFLADVNIEKFTGDH